AREVVVQGRLRDAHPLGERLHGGSPVARVQEEERRLPDDLVTTVSLGITSHPLLVHAGSFCSRHPLCPAESSDGDRMVNVSLIDQLALSACPPCRSPGVS